MKTSSSVPSCTTTWRTEPGHERFRRINGDDLPVIDNGDAIAEHLGFVHVVGRQQDGATAAAMALQHTPQLPA